MHPMQRHIRELATEIRNQPGPENRRTLGPIEREWCDCREIRERVCSELGEPGGIKPHLSAE